MKSFTAPIALCLLLACASAAAQQPGHAAPPAADSALPYKGKVVSVIDAGQYTYIEVAEDKKVIWLAAPAIALAKGSTIRFEDGAEMSNFRSKTLNRVFPSIRFINRVVVSGAK